MNTPNNHQDYITLAHGGGGTLTNRLIEEVFLDAFGNPQLNLRHDGAVCNLDAQRVAFTTDSYVVHPLFFPGGDIGSMAIHGTVNDLAMCGARPRYLSAGFILEESLPIDTLKRIVWSMREAAASVDVKIVTGDTKVVDRGKGDGVYINTTGIGTVLTDTIIAPKNIQAGDAVILSGDLGRHGIAIMTTREGLMLESAIESDSAPVVAPVMALLEGGVDVHCLRDLTRGGLASALNEMAVVSQLRLIIKEVDIPVREDVRGACEILGFDPLYVANEGRFVAIVDPQDATHAVDIMHQFEVSNQARIIGYTETANHGDVILNNRIGTKRILDMLSGEQLPRIC